MSRQEVPVPEQRAVLPSGLRSGHPTLVSQNAGLAYPVRDGVPILLVHEARRVCAPDPDPLG